MDSSYLDNLFKKPAGKFGVANGGLDEVFDPFKDPRLGLGRAAQEIFPQFSQGGGLEDGPIARFLNDRAGIAQRQFSLRQALQGLPANSGSFQDYAKGFTRGFFDEGNANPYANMDDIQGVLAQIGQAARGGASNSSPLQGLVDSANSDPNDFVQTILSLFQPNFAPRAFTGLAGRLAQLARNFQGLSLQDQQRTNFADAVASFLQQSAPGRAGDAALARRPA